MDRLIAAALAALLLLAACNDDGGDGAAPAVDTTVALTTTTIAPEAGDIEVPDIDGTLAIPVPSLGFGVAIPVGWQATLLTQEALDRVAEATLADEGFLEAARNVAATGAVFYAAGVAADGQVVEVKIDVQDDAQTDAAALEALAGQIVEAGDFDVASVGTGEHDQLAVFFELLLPGAEGDEEIRTYGVQMLVPDGERLWSVIVTAESKAAADAIHALVAESFVFDSSAEGSVSGS